MRRITGKYTLQHGRQRHRIIIVNIIMINRHELSLDGYVPASSNSLLNGLPNRLRPFGLQFNIIFGTLLFFILVTFRGQFDLCLLSFSSADYASDFSEISSFLCGQKECTWLF
jgi:hypothetical protein